MWNPSLDPPVFGDIECTDDNRVGSNCQFTCKVGYEIFGDQLRTCQNSHLWSGLMPKCTPTECPPLKSPANGLILCTADRAYRSICQFRCNDGFELFGNNIMECTAEKKWDPEDGPVCKEIVCNGTGLKFFPMTF